LVPYIGVREYFSCSYTYGLFAVLFLVVIMQVMACSFFLFQAEDGIRDRNVTGVQTCALPIFPPLLLRPRAARPGPRPTRSAPPPAAPGPVHAHWRWPPPRPSEACAGPSAPHRAHAAGPRVPPRRRRRLHPPHRYRRRPRGWRAGRYGPYRHRPPAGHGEGGT